MRTQKTERALALTVGRIAHSPANCTDMTGSHAGVIPVAMSASCRASFKHSQRSSAREAAEVADMDSDSPHVARGAAEGTGAVQSAGSATAGLISSARVASYAAFAWYCASPITLTP